MLRNETIVYIATNPWNDVWRRRQQLISRIAKNNRVLWVEPPLSLFSRPRSRIRLSRLLDCYWRPREVLENLFVFPLIMIIPFNRFSKVQKWNRAIYLMSLRRMVEKLGLKNPILWVTFSWSFEHFIGELDEKIVLYDCYDKYTGFEAARRLSMRRRIEAWEREVLEKAHFVFAASKKLKEDLKKFNANVSTIPNGVNFDLFSRALAVETEIPADMKKIKKPIIGEVGTISVRTDIDILHFVAQARRDWSIVLVGPIMPGVDNSAMDKLRKCENVHFLGMKEVGLLPNYLKGIDVALMTLKVDQETTMYTTHPNRFFEYMAAGKPIVTSRLHGMEEYSDVVKIAHCKEDFVPLISKCLEESDEALVKKRVKIAKNNSWDKRVETIENLVGNNL